MNKLKHKFINSTLVKNHSYFHLFKTSVYNSVLWRINCDSVARGVAIGLCTATIPLIPFQMVIALLLAILFRANLPIAILVSWVSNPFTFLPIVYFTYHVGNWILGETQTIATIGEFNWKYSNVHELWAYVTAEIFQFSKAYFVGLAIVSISVAMIGYVVTFLLWHVSVFLRKYWRKVKPRK